MWRDTIVEETRKVREEYAAKFDFDLDAIFLDLKGKEEQSSREVVRFEPRRPVPLTTG